MRLKESYFKNLSARKQIFSVLAFGWIVLIFCFSARPADLSTEDSNQIGRLIGQLVIDDFEQWDFAAQTEYAAGIDHFVRKTAHFVEYGVLGFLITGAVITGGRFYFPGKCWLFGTLYAGSDEFHQLFVPGRSGQISDVLLDSAGVLSGVILFVLILWEVKYLKEKKADRMENRNLNLTEK